MLLWGEDSNGKGLPAGRQGSGKREFPRGGSLETDGFQKSEIPARRTTKKSMNTKPLFSPTRTEGNFVFLSGQIGIKDGILVSENIKEQVAQAVENIVALLKKHNLLLESVIDVTAFLIDQEDYQPFNEIYSELFNEPFPTRTTVTVKSLPLGARVELKVISRAS